MSNIVFSEQAFSEYLYWQTQNRKTLRKINALLKEICRDPFRGEGQPEPLKGGNWSRRINEKDRLVYETTNDAVIVKQCKGHYGDK